MTRRDAQGRILPGARKADRVRLQRLCECIAMQVCDVRGHVTRAEADERERLEARVGETWDAINRRWQVRA